MKKKLFRITGLILSLLLTSSILNCGGGGGGGSDNGGGTTTTDDGITIPAGGSSGTVTLTGGTNKYGFQKIWKSGITSYPSIENIFNTLDTETTDELCIYFADNNIYLFWYLPRLTDSVLSSITTGVRAWSEWGERNRKSIIPSI